MAGERVEQRLAAVLAADVAGYSRLMGADEVGTLAALRCTDARSSIPPSPKHHGRIVKTTGCHGLLRHLRSMFVPGIFARH